MSMPLSNSSDNEFRGCEARWLYRKVLKLEGIEYDTSDALDFGKALHSIVEQCMWSMKPFIKNFNSFDVPELENLSESQRIRVLASAYKLITVQEASISEIIAVELGFQDDYSIGFIDFISTDGKRLFLGDLKTAARVDPSLEYRLPKDKQLNIYAAQFDKHIRPQLDSKYQELPFAGCIYRVAQKTKSKTDKFNIEDIDSIIKYSDKLTVKDFFIPNSLLEKSEIVLNQLKSQHEKTLKVAQYSSDALDIETTRELRNYNNCFNYFRPCQYFHICYGYKYGQDSGVKKREY